MEDEPYVIRLNIRHYEAMLQLPCGEERRRRLLKLLDEAHARLAAAESAERHRAGGTRR
ncbi:MAG: hypothetical protein KGJ66_04405 [Alphaproteobacteria bacterium]|nr:hypothetical protein [Alphaproteobacteria bacterium]